MSLTNDIKNHNQVNYFKAAWIWSLMKIHPGAVVKMFTRLYFPFIQYTGVTGLSWQFWLAENSGLNILYIFHTMYVYIQLGI